MPSSPHLAGVCIVSLNLLRGGSKDACAVGALLRAGIGLAVGAGPGLEWWGEWGESGGGQWVNSGVISQKVSLGASGEALTVKAELSLRREAASAVMTALRRRADLIILRCFFCVCLAGNCSQKQLHSESESACQ